MWTIEVVEVTKDGEVTRYQQTVDYLDLLSVIKAVNMIDRIEVPSMPKLFKELNPLSLAQTGGLKDA